MLTLGNCSNTGPIQRRTNARKTHETNVVIIETPPAASCTMLLVKDAVIGAQLKKLPAIFPPP